MLEWLTWVVVATVVVIGIGYAGSHVNIPADRVHLAIELCEPNGGLEYIDWSNAGCKNGAEFKTIGAAEDRQNND